MATRPIDEKLITMKLDNSDFDRKARETTGMLGRLKDSLNKIPGVNLDRVSRDFSKIQNAVNSTNLHPLQKAVESLSDRFSNLGIVAAGALATIGNKAVNVAQQMVHRSIRPITDGFSEYELKLKSIGTILANTKWAGSTLKDVNKTLDELNAYADQTVYNFGQMTDAIGRFTTAGVTLEDSAIAIKGMSNLAASTGSSAEQLNTAMYQMSQALSAGRIGLQDWNSLVNAGMAGKSTQDALVATARAMGKNVDLTKSFRLSLEQGWLTSEVFLETMKKFGKDESMIEAATKVRTLSALLGTLRESLGSGWAQTWESIIGDFDEATNIWTTLATTIIGFFSEAADRRNALFADIAKQRGFLNIFIGLNNILKSMISIFTAVRVGIQQAFPPATATQIATLTRGFLNFTKGLELSSVNIGRISLIIRGILSPFSLLFTIVKEVAGALFGAIPAFEGTGDGILGILGKLAKLSIAFTETIRNSGLFKLIIEGLRAGFSTIGTTIEFLVKMIASFGDIASNVWNRLTFGMGKAKGGEAPEWILYLSDAFKSFGKVLSNVQVPIDAISNTLTSFFEGIATAYNWVKAKLADIGQFFKDMWSSITNVFADNQGYILAGGGLAAIGAVVYRVWTVFSNFSNFLENLSEGLEGVADALNAFSWQMRANALVTAAIAIGILAVSLTALSKLEWKEIGKGLYGVMGAMTALLLAVGLMGKYDLGLGLETSTLQLIALATAVLIMSTAIEKIGKLDPEQIGNGVIALTTLLLALGVAMAIMAGAGKDPLGASSVQILAMAGAISIMSKSMVLLSTLDKDQLILGLETIGFLLLELAAFMELMERNRFSIAQSIAVGLLTVAIMNMVGSIKLISLIDKGELKKGLITIGLILAGISTFALLTKKTNLFGAALGVLAIAAAMNLLVIAIQAFGKTKPDVISRGLVVMTISLLAIAGSIKAMGGGKSLMLAGVGILAISVALNALVKPIQELGKTDTMILVKGILSIGLAVASIGLAMATMGGAPGAIAAGIAMAALGAALILFIKPIQLLGEMSIWDVIKSITGLVAALISITAIAVGVVATGAVVALYAFAAAIAVLGIAMSAAGLGFYLFGQGLLLLSTLTVGGVAVIVAALGALITGIGMLIPAATDLMGKIINGMIQAMARNTPGFIRAVANFMVAFMDGMTKHAPRIIDSAVNMIITLSNKMSATIIERGPELEDAMRNVMYALLIPVSKIGEELMITMYGWIPGAKEAITKMGAETRKQLKEKVKLADIATDKGKEYNKALEATSPETKKSAEKMAKSGKEGAESVKMDASGKMFGQGFANGIESKMDTVASAGGLLGSIASNTLKKVLGVESPARETTKTGYDFGAGLEKGIKESSPQSEAAAENMGKKSVDALNKGVRSKKGEARKTVKELEEERLKGIEDARRKQFDMDKQRIDDRKAYNQLSLTQELNAWQIVMNKYKKGTEERKEAEREVYRLKNEINKRLIEINEEYANKVSDVNKRLIEGERQLTEEYERSVADRTKSLASFVGLFDKVSEKEDVTGKGLLENLQGQVDAFAYWMHDMETLGKRGLDKGLLDTLRAMGPSAASEIAALTTLSDAELTKYAELWKEKNTYAKAGAIIELEDLKIQTSVKIKELREAAVRDLESYKQDWLAKIREIKYGTPKQFVGLDASMATIGKNAIQGMIDGMKDMNGPLANQAKAMANTIKNTIKNTLGIKSPSKVLMSLGKAIGEGLAVGIDQSVRRVESSARNLSTIAGDSINPRITPDLSFARRSLGAATSRFRQNDDIIAKVTTPSTNSTLVTQNLIFNSQQLTPSEVARKNLQASRQLAMQWGV